jgi:hypothetical protein
VFPETKNARKSVVRSTQNIKQSAQEHFSRVETGKWEEDGKSGSNLTITALLHISFIILAVKAGRRT